MTGKGYRGYVFSRPIDGSSIPQRVQNLVIREYAGSRGLLFLLSATEYYMDGCYMMLRAITQQLDEVEGFIFYSLDMLPPEEQGRRSFYARVLERGKTVHFALEECKLATAADADALEEILNLKRLAAPPPFV